MILLKFRANWSDEFDVGGTTVHTGNFDFEEWKELAKSIDAVKGEVHAEEIEIGFGTNEWLDFNSWTQALDHFKVIEVPEEYIEAVEWLEKAGAFDAFPLDGQRVLERLAEAEQDLEEERWKQSLPPIDETDPRVIRAREIRVLLQNEWAVEREHRMVQHQFNLFKVYKDCDECVARDKLQHDLNKELREIAEELGYYHKDFGIAPGI